MLSLAVVCEAPADQRTGCGLADRVFCAEVSGLKSGSLDRNRLWRGFTTTECCVLWADLKHIARDKKIRIPHGHFDGEPKKSDAAAARRALRVLMYADVPPHAIVMLRDGDRDGERLQGLEQARRESRLGVPVVLGVANVMRECWVLAGFEPKSDAERSRLDTFRRELGFDPREKAHLLRAKHFPDKNSPKRVLDALTAGDHDREARCWQEADLEVLKQRGKSNGLKDYLAEVQRHLVPLLKTQS